MISTADIVMVDHNGGNIDADHDDDNIDDHDDLIDADDTILMLMMVIQCPTLTEGVAAFSPLTEFSSGAPVHS